MTKTPGNLYFIPSLLGESNTSDVLPERVREVIAKTQIFVVENIRSARRFIRKVEHEKDIDSLVFYELNKHTSHEMVANYLNEAMHGSDIGMISEAGIPGVADPGAELAAIAHAKGIRVVPLVGPSSILLALSASGLNGQSFAFNGYLPIKQSERIESIKFYEKRALAEKQTQIFIETPYRNMALFEDLTVYLNPEINLCIAVDISLDTEYIFTQKAVLWKKNKPALHKRPAIFLFNVS